MRRQRRWVCLIRNDMHLLITVDIRCICLTIWAAQRCNWRPTNWVVRGVGCFRCNFSGCLTINQHGVPRNLIARQLKDRESFTRLTSLRDNRLCNISLAHCLWVRHQNCLLLCVLGITNVNHLINRIVIIKVVRIGINLRPTRNLIFNLNW